MSVVYEEVSQGVDGVVVEAVFEGEFVCGWSIGVVIAGQGLDEARALGGNYKAGFACAIADGPADKLDTFSDAASAIADVYA